MELLEWKQSLSIAIPTSSTSGPKKIRFVKDALNLPANMEASGICGMPSSRAPGGGAMWIEVALLTAERESFCALGLVFLAYALSVQNEALRLKLSGTAEGLSELIIWPSEASTIEVRGGLRQQIVEVYYQPRLPKNNPNYTVDEQDDPTYPREHLPYCRLGAPNASGVSLKDQPVCIHFQGTAPSLVWLGKYLLDFSLSDNHARIAYLYNSLPNESMAPLSGELRLTVSNTGKPEMFPPEMF